MNISLGIAAAIALVTCAIHTFVGTPEVVRPLMTSSLPPVVRATHLYTWHMVTLLLDAMAGGYAYAAWVPSGTDLAWFVTALSAAFMLWNILLFLRSRHSPLELPQWILFAALTLALVP